MSEKVNEGARPCATNEDAIDIYLGRGLRSIDDFTALPWRHTASGGLIRSRYGECVAIVSSPPREVASLWEVARYRRDVGERIVRAVNSHDDLLAACKRALGAFERNDCIDWSELEAAIAKAEGRSHV